MGEILGIGLPPCGKNGGRTRAFPLLKSTELSWFKVYARLGLPAMHLNLISCSSGG